MLLKLKLTLLALLLMFTSLTANPEQIRIAWAKSAQNIDAALSQQMMVRSFMEAYKDLPPTTLSPQFSTTEDVRHFYEDYFQAELAKFKTGALFWVEAYLNDRLVGWATFTLESNKKSAAHLNLLVVAPEYQKRGIGRRLTFSICELFPHIATINLLIRKVNAEGYKFYYSLGFSDVRIDDPFFAELRWSKQ